MGRLCSTIFLGILTPPSPTLAPGLKQDRDYMEHLEELLTRNSNYLPLQVSVVLVISRWKCVR